MEETADIHEPSAISEHPETKLGVYPNPTQGRTNISLTLSNSEDVTLEIYNSSGQKIYTQSNIYLPAGDQVIRWDGSGNSGNAMLP